MKYSARILRHQKRLARKEKLHKRAILGVAARERIRLAQVAQEPVRVEWRGRHEFTFVCINRMTGEMHSLDLFRGKRRDQYRATVDGKPWRESVSATQLGKTFRDKLKAHVAP